MKKVILSFFFGDLNFRLNLKNDEIRKSIDNLSKNDSIKLLYNFDELKRAMKESPYFENYSEDKLNFFPTYKYDFHTNDYDTSKKKELQLGLIYFNFYKNLFY